MKNSIASHWIIVRLLLVSTPLLPLNQSAHCISLIAQKIGASYESLIGFDEKSFFAFHRVTTRQTPRVRRIFLFLLFGWVSADRRAKKRQTFNELLTDFDLFLSSKQKVLTLSWHSFRFVLLTQFLFPAPTPIAIKKARFEILVSRAWWRLLLRGWKFIWSEDLVSWAVPPIDCCHAGGVMMQSDR